MSHYRVLLEDHHRPSGRQNSELFKFAINVEAEGLMGAEKQARSEFPEADVVDIRKIVEDVGQENL